MANADIASTLINFLASNPELVTSFLQHPYSVTQQATGASEQLNQTDMSQVVTAAAALATGQQVDFSNLASVASALLSQNGGSVHTLTQSLFGTPQQAQSVGAAQQSSGLDLGTLVNLAGALMGGGSSASAAATTTATTTSKKKKKTTGADLIDLSDGIDATDLIGLASLLISNK